MPAAKAITGSSNTSGALLLGSAIPTTNDAEYGGPAPANHGRRHPEPGNYTPANSEEPSIPWERRFSGACAHPIPSASTRNSKSPAVGQGSLSTTTQV